MVIGIKGYKRDGNMMYPCRNQEIENYYRLIADAKNILTMPRDQGMVLDAARPAARRIASGARPARSADADDREPAAEPVAVRRAHADLDPQVRPAPAVGAGAGVDRAAGARRS